MTAELIVHSQGNLRTTVQNFTPDPRPHFVAVEIAEDGARISMYIQVQHLDQFIEKMGEAVLALEVIRDRYFTPRPVFVWHHTLNTAAGLAHHAQRCNLPQCSPGHPAAIALRKALS